MYPTRQPSSSLSQFDPMPARPKSGTNASAPDMAHSFTACKRSSPAPLQAAAAGNTTLARFKEAELPGASIYDIPLYCCRVCEIESLPSTQTYSGPDEFHPLRLVGAEVNEEWFRIHCAPATIEQQVIVGREWLLQQPVRLGQRVRVEREEAVQAMEAAAPSRQDQVSRPPRRGLWRACRIKRPQ